MIRLRGVRIYTNTNMAIFISKTFHFIIIASLFCLVWPSYKSVMGSECHIHHLPWCLCFVIQFLNKAIFDVLNKGWFNWRFIATWCLKVFWRAFAIVFPGKWRPNYKECAWLVIVGFAVQVCMILGIILPWIYSLATGCFRSIPKWKPWFLIPSV